MTVGHLRRTLGVVGELLVTAGVVVLLFVAYLLWWTGVQTAQAQDRLSDELARAAPQRPGGSAGDPAGPGPGSPGPGSPLVGTRAPEEGRAYFRLRIPRLGPDWSWVVVEGVTLDDLAEGPGHYPGSARPGQVGNLAIAGHRATHGEPFAYLDQVGVRDRLVIEQGVASWTYRVTQSFLTTPEDIDVVAPVPGRPGARPTQARVTLTTCDPRFGSERRLIVEGVLERPT